MIIKKYLVLLSFIVLSNHLMIEKSLGDDFPWPMFLGGIAQANKKCNGVVTSNPDGTYEGRVKGFKEQYCKNDEWEAWMIANKARYAKTFLSSSVLPSAINISFRYETKPINYSPAWTSETEHMKVLTTMAQGAYPGYKFNIVFNSNTTTSYANIIAGTAGTTSYTYGKNVYLYYETIFNHEFAHVMKLPHHYDSNGDIGDGHHMPPGETQCIMDRNSSLFCSACKTTLGIPLDISDTSAMDAAMNDILSRYPDPNTPCWLYQC